MSGRWCGVEGGVEWKVMWRGSGRWCGVEGGVDGEWKVVWRVNNVTCVTFSRHLSIYLNPAGTCFMLSNQLK